MQNGDPLGRLVMRCDYDMLDNRLHQASMEAGERWVLNDVAGNPVRIWDSRDHVFRTEHDPANPAADASGMVKLPNVNMLVEMADMREANRSYEANLQVIKQARAMVASVIDLLKS